VRKLQQNPPSKLGCLKEIVSKSPPHVIQTQKHMVASNRPLTQDSRSAYPKEQIEVPKDLEMAKSKEVSRDQPQARYTLHLLPKFTSWI